MSSPSVRFNQAGDIPNYISKTYCHIIFPFFPKLAELAFSVRFHHQIPVYISLLPIRAACHAHLINVKSANKTANTNIYTCNESRVTAWIKNEGDINSLHINNHDTHLIHWVPHSGASCQGHMGIISCLYPKIQLS